MTVHGCRWREYFGAIPRLPNVLDCIAECVPLAKAVLRVHVLSIHTFACLTITLHATRILFVRVSVLACTRVCFIIANLNIQVATIMIERIIEGKVLTDTFDVVNENWSNNNDSR
jgi:hypothetical protein